VGWWWALWIISNVLGNAVFRLSTRAESVNDLIGVNWLYLVAGVTNIAAGLLCIRIITRRQEVRYHSLYSLA
jgi:sugar phosphate permease